MLIGPPTVGSIREYSSIAALRAAAASVVVGGRTSFANVSRRNGEFLLAKYPVLEQFCGTIGDFAQIIGLPSINPAEIMPMLFPFVNGIHSRKPKRISSTGLASR